MIDLVSKLRLSFSLPAIILLVAPITHAANDWNTPCFDGVCEYSLTAAPGQNGSGTVQIWGSSNAISDITTAAGWQILNCSSTAMAQDIRLMCMNNDTAAAGCQHLFQGGDAEGKLVRLPENCGMSAFARVAKSYIPDDQSVPADIAARFIRRDGNSSTPQVRGLSLDTNWSAIDPSKYGNVNIAVRGANVPGADVNGTLVPTSSSRRRSRLVGRGLTDFVGDAIDSIKNLDSFNFNKTVALPPISVNKAATILNKDIKCGPVDLNANVSVDGKASAQISVGAAASGTIVPPKVDDFAALVLMNGDLDGTLNLNAAISTTFDTGKIEVVPPLGIPGLDFPGILTIGPSFDVSAEATAKLDLAADLQVGIVYNISNAQLVFPDKNGQSGGGFNVGDTPLTLSLTPSVKSTGSLTAHLIPSLNLGVQALDNLASATVFLNLDASATMALSLDAVDSNSVTINSGSNSSSSDSSSNTTSSNSTSTTTSLNSTGTTVASTTSAALSSNSTSAAVSDNSTSVTTSSNTTSATVLSSSAASPSSAASKSKRSVARVRPTSVVQAISAAKRAAASSANATSSSNNSSSSVSESSSGVQFGGCVEIDTGLSVNAGAQGTFFDLFDASTQVPLFSKEFVLFKKCFGNGDSTPSRRSLTSPLGLRRPLPRYTSPRRIDAIFERAAAAAAKAPVASNSTASDSEACLSSSFAPPIPITGSIQIGSAT
ncbi:hypothetical protein GYMLUDRAFT_71501 [Collybiopsis luxurians FD-317 M1]|uniref:Uncharacterized protein n=1 Tax=Collybiopsis luxurians FD-317 M1 TaxID=944289 RepID=A0A0D0BIX3_9AGAR|nr:hypothetical protein GYMLUDRAFT_71501 [Collybiopsis luxurians FD-317 M1]